MPKSLTSKPSPRSSRDKVRAHRAKLRKQGFRPVQIWVPNVNSEEFKSEARRQSSLIAADPREKEIMDFIEAITDWDDVR